ncbi:hypothetical protein FA13DRAFT_1120295 [Coprinellus micaceus]|uniref:Uncharacterized protein n=1 Tax=Coprinellus micaceus TaxID=71717 RepID=A0A4Y7SVR6_COPMI|nr:hypothetical protein FA13DRAFT_1120295 [Coprinellus micaceus]
MSGKQAGRQRASQRLWIISKNGYANIVPSPGDIVYRLIYELSEAEGAFLDRSEGVPYNHAKEMVSVEFVPVDPAFLKATIIAQNMEKEGSQATKEIMTYVNRQKHRTKAALGGVCREDKQGGHRRYSVWDSRGVLREGYQTFHFSSVGGRG